MPYRIVYEPEESRPPSFRGIRRGIMTVCLFLSFLTAVNRFWPEGKEILRTVLIPGDPERTLEAAHVFALEIQNGFPLKDAAANFCISILAHGNGG